MICATKDLATKLEEKLRHHYDVKLDILDSHNDKNGDNINVCEIKAKTSGSNLFDFPSLFTPKIEGTNLRYFQASGICIHIDWRFGGSGG